LPAGMKLSPQKGTYAPVKSNDEEEDFMAPKVAETPTRHSLKIGYFLLALVAACFIAGTTVSSEKPEEVEIAVVKSEDCPDIDPDPCWNHHCQEQGDIQAVCLVESGSPICNCSLFYTEASGVCQPAEDCDAQKCGGRGTCHQIPSGGYFCRCDTGYFFNEDTCEDINGCDYADCGGVQAGECIDTTAENEALGAAPYSCKCELGYLFSTVSGSCEDIDPCCEQIAKDNCNVGVCVDEEPPSVGSHCDCPACHVTCDANKEQDSDGDYCCKVDYCLSGGSSNCDSFLVAGDTSPHNICIDEACGYSCDCASGYERSMNGIGEAVCKEIESCDEDATAKCAAADVFSEENGQCVDLPPPSETYVCDCDSCYFGCDANGNAMSQPTHCCHEDTCAGNKCSTLIFPNEFNKDTPDNSECVQTQCSYTCNCNPGFAHCGDDVQTCTEIDPCAETSPCGAPKTGSACDGFPPKKGTCIDTAPPSEGYTCDCPSCWVSSKLTEFIDGEKCEYVDPCEAGGLAKCTQTDFAATCDNKYPNCDHSCLCTRGFHFCVAEGACGLEGGDQETCCDIDSCQKCGDDDPQKKCASKDEFGDFHGTCIDQPAPLESYDCDCETCYTFKDGSCIKNEYCNAGLSACQSNGDNGLTFPGHTAAAGCTEEKCDFTCECTSGFEPCANGKSCCEINRCETQCQGIDEHTEVTWPDGGVCVDEDPPSPNWHCECNECYQELNGQCYRQDQCIDNLCNQNDDQAICNQDQDVCDHYCVCGVGYEHCTDPESPDSVPDKHTCCQVNPCDDKYPPQPDAPENPCECVDKPANTRQDDFTCNCPACYKTEDLPFGQKCVYNDPCENNYACSADRTKTHYSDQVDVDGQCQNNKDQSPNYGCDWTCKCSPGFEQCKVPGGVDARTCCEIDACDSTAQNACAAPDVYGPVHGTCVDDAAPSTGYNCKCDDCYVAAGGACQKVNYCEKTGTAMCSINGDLQAQCIEQKCGYTCDCSTGYDSKDGTCVDHDSCGDDDPCWVTKEKDSIQRSNDHTCVDSPAPSLKTLDAANQVVDWGYTCYCACGFTFFEGTCTPCTVDLDVNLKGTGALSTYGAVTNDATRIFVYIDVTGTGYEISNIEVNINNQADGALVTSVDKASFSTTSTLRPDPKKFGVRAGTALDKPFSSSERNWLFSIPLSDVDFEKSCDLYVMAHVTLVCVDLTNEICTKGDTDEAWISANGGENLVQNTETPEWFAYAPYTPCGLEYSNGSCQPET